MCKLITLAPHSYWLGKWEGTQPRGLPRPRSAEARLLRPSTDTPARDLQLAHSQSAEEPGLFIPPAHPQRLAGRSSTATLRTVGGTTLREGSGTTLSGTTLRSIQICRKANARLVIFQICIQNTVLKFRSKMRVKSCREEMRNCNNFAMKH